MCAITSICNRLKTAGKAFLQHKPLRIAPLFIAAAILFQPLQVNAADQVGYIAGELDVSGGSASYSIPIAVPPGIAGMEPILSLNYNSQSGNGLLGLGWNLGGLSVVHRCGSTMAQDGANKAIKLTRDDNYCIDGQRLVPVSGTKGANGTVYRTEQDGFSKIVSYGSAGNGPAWFKVWTKSGQIMEYGNNANSRIEAQGKATVMTWATNKLSDTAGNAINFKYNEVTANSEFVPDVISYGPNGTSQVRFSYSDITDLPGEKFEGSNFKTSKRLSGIETYVSDELVQNWGFDFDEVAKKPAKLTSVELCDANNNCMSKTTFEWSDYQQKTYSTAEPQFIDFNGDGLADKHSWGGIIRGKTALKVQLNTGHGYAVEKVWAGSIKTVASQVLDSSRDFAYKTVYSNPTLYFADFNGDGKTDFLAKRPSGTNLSGRQYYHNTYLSTGSGFSRIKENQFLSFTAFGDVNGDGRTDIIGTGGKVRITSSNGVIGSEVQWGPEFKTVRKKVTSCKPAGDSGIPECSTRNANVYPGCSAIDINGDSLMDQICNGSWVYAVGDDGYKYYPSLNAFSTNADKVQLVTRISNNTRTSINYSHISDSAVHHNSGFMAKAKDLRGQMFLVSKVTADNGAGGTNTTQYKYNGAKLHRTGRGFLGFNWAEELDAATGTKVRTTFRQDYPFVGMPKRMQTWLSDGTLISDSSTTYKDRTSTGGKVHFTHVTNSREKSYERDGTLISTTTTANSGFDAYGNLGKATVTTTAGGETYGKVTTNTYTNHTDNGQWILGRLTSASVEHQHADGSSLTRSSSFGYDPTTGFINKEVIEPGSATSLTTTYSYDSYGNKTQVTSAAADEADRTTVTVYDDNGQFPVKTSNANNHSESRVVDPRYGNIISRTGPNGLTTSYTFDGFGNAQGEARADGNKSSVTTLWIADCPQTVSGAAYCVVSKSDGSAQVVKYFDKLNRGIRTVAVGFDGRRVFTDTRYNSLGQVTKVSRPYYEGDTQVWGSSEYDDMGRVIRMLEPGPDNTTKVSSTSYNGLTTTVTNPANQQKTTVTNALGKIVAIQEPEGASLSYRYDALGNLLETEDDQGNITRISYDLFGRKTAMDDPDMGVWTYRYNGFGELISQADAKGQTSTLEYDILGRMIKRSEAEGVSQWFYDTAANGIGKLARVTGPAGYTQTPTYDNLGRLSSSTTEADGKTLKVSTEYDQYNRVAAVHRPQGFTTENVYTENGHLKAVRSPKTAVLQNEFVVLFEQMLSRQAELIVQAEHYRDQATAYRNQASTYRDQIRAIEEQTDVQTSAALRNAANRLEQAATNLMNASAQSKGFANNIRKTLLGFTASYSDELQAAIASARSKSQQMAAKFSLAVEKGLDQAAALLLTAATDTAAQAQLSAVLSETEAQLEMVEDLQLQLQALEQDSLALGEQLARYDAVQTQQQGDYITFWQAKTRDASGRLLEELYGNGLSSQYTYDNSNGLMTSQRSGFLYNEDIRHLTYQYDQLNNVTQRADLVGDVQESFRYDGLDRLISSTVTSQLQDLSYNKSVTYQYDTLGNITYKSDVGHYLYGSGVGSSANSNGGAGPHAVVAAGSKSYNYDANGNMTDGGGRSIQWSSFNKPLQITKDDKTVGFSYAPNRARYLKTGSDGSRTLYLGKLYEQITKGQEVTHKQFIYAGGSLVAIHNSGLDSLGAPKADQTRYMHKDNLGSIDTITDSVGNVVDRMSFDPFGQRRQNNWRDNTTGISLIPVLTNRGFTGHEHLDDVGLIHMNGRVYDAELGRFLSADPHIQFASASQSFNRYSYVMNNPMKYTDPSGYFSFNPFKAIKSAWKASWGRVKKLFRAIAKVPILNVIAQAVVCFYTGPAGCAAYSAMSTYAVTGNLGMALKSGLVSYVSASMAIDGGISLDGVGQHALWGGVASKLQGGRFKDGFLSGAFSAGISGVTRWGANLKSVTGQVLVSGAISGTASVIGGGKFANGAAGRITSGYLYGDYSAPSGGDDGYGNHFDNEKFGGALAQNEMDTKWLPATYYETEVLRSGGTNGMLGTGLSFFGQLVGGNAGSQLGGVGGSLLDYDEMTTYRVKYKGLEEWQYTSDHHYIEESIGGKKYLFNDTKGHWLRTGQRRHLDEVSRTARSREKKYSYRD